MGMEFSFCRFGGTNVEFESLPPRSKRGSLIVDAGPTEADVVFAIGTGVGERTGGGGGGTNCCC